MAAVPRHDPHTVSHSDPLPDMAPQTLALAAGRPALFFGHSGAALHIARGSAALAEPPVWMAEQLHWPSQTLAAGMVLRLPRTGWYQLRPLCDTVVELRERPAWFPVRQLARILAAWRRRRARIRPIHRSHKESVS